jgi:hypothetical protein
MPLRMDDIRHAKNTDRESVTRLVMNAPRAVQCNLTSLNPFKERAVIATCATMAP